MAACWYVVRTKSHREQLAHATISAAGFHAFLPMTVVERRHAGKRERVQRPIFPRYLFVEFDRLKQRFGQLNYCKGVSSRGLVCSVNDVPLPVPNEIVEGIRERERVEMARAGETVSGYQQGDTFVVTVGNWAQLVATYNREDHGFVWATVQLFGMEKMVRLPFESVPVCSAHVDSLYL